MKTVIQVLKEEREMLTEMIASGNYDNLKEYVKKLEDKIKELEGMFSHE